MAVIFLQALYFGLSLLNGGQLSDYEVQYINRQQGFCCKSCFTSLRSMALSAAILSEYRFDGTLEQFCDVSSELKLLEINTAGNLTSYLCFGKTKF